MEQKESTSRSCRNVKFAKSLIFHLSLFLIGFSSMSTMPAYASSFIRLNHESIRWRAIATTLMESMKAVRETLMVANTILPVRVQALSENSQPGSAKNFNSEQFYKDMIAKKSSDEVLQIFIDFLVEDDENALSIAIENIFVKGRRDYFFVHGTVKFHIRWFWLYIDQNGLALVQQENMTDEIAQKIWDSRMLFPVIEVHYAFSDKSSRISAFFQRGVDKILTQFPSAYLSEIEDGSTEIVHLIFPDVTGVPAIIRKTIELKH